MQTFQFLRQRSKDLICLPRPLVENPRPAIGRGLPIVYIRSKKGSRCIILKPCKDCTFRKFLENFPNVFN